MDLTSYYNDMRKVEADLESRFGKQGFVYLTSKFYRERNSTEGSTASASFKNAARVITDGTHREANEAEIAAFLKRQQNEFEKHTNAEQQKKSSYLVVLPGASQVAGQIPQVTQPPQATPAGVATNKSSSKE